MINENETDPNLSLNEKQHLNIPIPNSIYIYLFNQKIISNGDELTYFNSMKLKYNMKCKIWYYDLL